MSRLLAMLALISSPALFAAPVYVYGTGFGPHGALKAGAVDPYFTVTPGWTTTPEAAYVASRAGVKQNDWWRGTKLSQWITPDPDATDAFPNTTFDYTTTINLTGKDAAAYVLTGSVAADDIVTILLNGVVVGSDDNLNAWLKKDPFTISSGFVAGVNTLTFEVTNLDGPTGLDVQLAGVITPEPASIGLMALGFLAAAGVAGFRAKGRQTASVVG